MPALSRRVRRIFVVGLAALALAGCSLSGDSPTPSPTATATPRPFTVMSTDPVRVSDPAAMTDAASAMLAVNVFQRLMTSEPGATALKPDAARDCGFFAAPTIYTCTLNAGLTFHNGHPLTASDVKFSIERAARLNVFGSSASLLSSLRTIETPDEVTIRFLLSRVDTQFGWALASPAASIVDEEEYSTDEIRPAQQTPIGSGPYAVAASDDEAIELTRFVPYIGFTPAKLDSLVYRTAPDSATIEDAMDKGAVDVVWRGLNNAAITRFTQQQQQNGTSTTTNGFTEHVLTGKRVLQIGWSAESANRTNRPLRQAIAAALQGDRTSDSVVPGGVPGHVTSFPLGGKASPKVTWQSRIKLTLGYDSTAPNGQDIATQIRTRLENTGGLSVQVRPDEARADLVLLDRKAWTPTAVAWLQPYLDAPLSGSKATVESTESQFRATYDNDEKANQLLVALQKQAGVDQVVLPISQSDELVYTRAGVQIADNSYGPGWQLGLFGINNG